jgi:hypothetical protein
MSAQEVMKGELDLFSPVNFQHSIDNSQLIQYRPINALTETSTIQFEIPTSPDEYLDLQNIFLWMQGKLVKLDGSNYPAAEDDRYSLVNYALNTIFDQVTIYLGTTQISHSSNTYHYLSYIEGLLFSDIEGSQSYLKSAGFANYWNRDIHNFEAIDAELHRNVKRSRTFTLYGRMHNAIFNSSRLLLNGLPLKIELHRANPAFYSMGSAPIVAQQGPPVVAALAAAEPKLNLIDISLFVRKVKLVPSILSAHAQELTKRNALYPIKRSEITVRNLSAGQTTFNLNNIYTGQLPCKLILGLVSNTAFSGSYIANPFAFKPYNLNYLLVNVNGEFYPKLPYTPDYDNSIYEREYYDLFSNLSKTKLFRDSGAKPLNPIDIVQYKEGLCLYAFNLNPDFENPYDEEYINLPKDGFINIELKFSAVLGNALKLICYAQFDNTIEIDENRNVTTDW